MNFLKEASYDDFYKEYEIDEVGNGYIKVNKYSYIINAKLFDLVKRGAKKMTVKEISKELGYDVEIIDDFNVGDRVKVTNLNDAYGTVETISNNKCYINFEKWNLIDTWYRFDKLTKIKEDK